MNPSKFVMKFIWLLLQYNFYVCWSCHRLQGSCNHVAGVLFRVEHFVRNGYTGLTCTSQSSQWDVPEDAWVNKPLRLSQINWKKDKYYNQGELFKISPTTATSYYENNFLPVHR